MKLQLYAHPFSSYCQKVLIALYEYDLPFEWKLLSMDDPATGAEFAALWPIRRMPVLVDDGETVLESSTIVEHLGRRCTSPASLIPPDPKTALEARTMDRIFDNYVMTPMQKVVADRIRAADVRDPYGVNEAKALLERAYAWLDEKLAGRAWAAGDGFTIADCAGAPSLFYADWVHPIAERYATVRAYRSRVLARPSVARAVDEARPYRKIFPGGAPERD